MYLQSAGKWTNYTLSSIDDLDSIIDIAPEGNIYFSAVSRNGNSRNDPAVAMPGLWLDLDFKHERKPDGIPENKVNEFLGEIPYDPTVIVNTGNGLHLWWLFENVMDIAGNEQYVYEIFSVVATQTIRNSL